MEKEARLTMSEAWERAVELERGDRCEEAERVLRGAMDSLMQVSQVAHLYELRMVRLLASGDRAGAEAACAASNRWMQIMASGATSGGEGAALSAEADAHERRLAGLMRAGGR